MRALAYALLAALLSLSGATHGADRVSLSCSTAASVFATAPAAGTVRCVSDIGVAGSLWIYSSTASRWKPVTGRVVLAKLPAAVAGITNSEQIVLQALVPNANVLRAGDEIRIEYELEKSGTTDTGQVIVRIGTAGTTGDTQITGTGGATMAAANQAQGATYSMKMQSATSIKKSGPGTGPQGSLQGGFTNAAAAATTITSAASNALYVNVSMASGGATNTLTAHDVTIDLVVP